MRRELPAARRWKGLARRGFDQLACAAVAALFLVPLAWVVAASLRAPGQPPPRAVEWLPEPVSWANYADLFALLPFGTYSLNSLLVTGAAIPLTLVTASWAGLGMAQLDARWRRRLVLFSLALLLVPVTSLWLTRFVLFRWLGLVNTFGALLAPALMGSSPLFALLFYWTFRRIPAELFESARLDGAGPLALWARLALPLSRPTVTAVAVLTFLLYWSDFINPLLYLKSPRLYTLPVGLQQLQQLDRSNWPLLMAAAVLLAAPAALMFLAVQRRFLKESRLGGWAG
jgi:multiple sugar transport system permease protein